jgi:hypothetical protein
MLITKTWQVAWDQWEHRNGFVHEAPEYKVVMKEVTDAIRRQHGQGPQGLPRCDHHLFTTTLHTLLTAQPVVQRAWLANVHEARQRAQRRDEAGYRGERQLMRAWLARGS